MNKRNTFVINCHWGWQITLLSVARCSQRRNGYSCIFTFDRLDWKIKVDSTECPRASMAHFLNSRSINQGVYPQSQKNEVFRPQKTKAYLCGTWGLLDQRRKENIEFLKKSGKSVLLAIGWSTLYSQQWGHDFRPRYRRNQVHCSPDRTHSSISHRLTATATPESAARNHTGGIFKWRKAWFISKIFPSTGLILFYWGSPKSQKEWSKKRPDKFIQRSFKGNSGIHYCLELERR